MCVVIDQDQQDERAWAGTDGPVIDLSPRRKSQPRNGLTGPGIASKWRTREMGRTDRDYLLERAEEELRLGEAAKSKKAADAHFELAGRYFDLAYRGPDNAPAVSYQAPAIVAA